MSMVSKGRLAALVLASLICISCGDVYRPTIVPEPVTPPNPQNFHAVFTANTNGMANPGSALQVDVSGDSNAGTTNVGIAPVHLAVQAGASSVQTRVWSANPGSSSVTVFTAAGTLGSISTSTTINLRQDPTSPAPMPVFVHSTESGTMYVANFATDNVTVIGTPTNAITATIPVPAGGHPWAMAETPDAHKLYIVDNGTNDVTSINTTDRSLAAIIPTGNSPQWAVARSDSHRVYVLAADGTLTTIDSEFTSGTVDTAHSFNLGDTSQTGLPVAYANVLTYDSRLNRLYIPFVTPDASGGGLYDYEVAIYDASQPQPALIKVIPLNAKVPTPCSLQCVPISVTALQDGTRAYLASYTIDSNTANCASTQVVNLPAQPCVAVRVTVLNELNNTVSKTIPLPEVAESGPVAPVNCANPAAVRFRMLAASAADSTRVYVSNCDAGGVSSIRTTDDTYVLNLTAPQGIFTPPLVHIVAASFDSVAQTVTYTYDTGDAVLKVKQTIIVSGIADSNVPGIDHDNGTFVITALGSNTFTVSNPFGVSSNPSDPLLNGFGVPQPQPTPPAQSPLFLVAGP
jgi:YVTN family beta-propeller protein